MPLSESFVAGDPLPATTAAAFAKAINRGFFAGEVKDFFGLAADVPNGFLIASGGTVGNASSNATARANADMTYLFAVLWAVGNSNGSLVIYDSTGAVTTFGANAAADFAANKAMALPNLCDMVTAGVGTYSKIFTISSVSSSTDQLTVPSNSQLYTGQAVLFTGSSPPGGLSNTTTYYVVRVDATHVRLASTKEDASVGNYIDLTTAGSGTMTLTLTLTARVVGDIAGEETHLLQRAELPPLGGTDLYYDLGGGTTKRYTGTNGSVTANSNRTFLTDADLQSAPHNNMQPTVFLYKIIGTGVVW